jgi:uncharacterized protein YbjT (DUF2867 family)
MIVVTTPTGNIGSQVVKNLLAANEAVRVIVRDPAKLTPEVRGKVDVVQGSSDDGSVLSARVKSQGVKRVVAVSAVGRRVAARVLWREPADSKKDIPTSTSTAR